MRSKVKATLFVTVILWVVAMIVWPGCATPSLPSIRKPISSRTTRDFAFLKSGQLSRSHFAHAMKSKLITIAVVIAAAIGGFFVGRYFTAKSWNHSFEEYAHMRESDQAHQMVRALTYLRDGKPSEAADLMELYLDSALNTFCVYEDRVAPAERADYVIRAARVGRDYRSVHPWTNSSPILAESVQKVFRLAN
jgi:hypothetical protein